VQELAALLGAPVVLQSFSSLANFPNNDIHWQGELPGSQAGVQKVFAQHDVAFLCGYGPQAQVAVFKHSDGPLIPASVRQIHLPLLLGQWNLVSENHRILCHFHLKPSHLN